ncbi:MAG: sigma-70 family RNA polymerase sigma factor [Bacilli bacterium]
MVSSLERTDKEFISIYNRHINTVYRVCFMYLKNKHDTEDACQTTFTKLLKYCGNFESVEHEKAWLIVTATNTCKNYFKTWYWRNTIITDEFEVTSKEEQNILEDVLKLPFKYKKIIYLYYYEGYSTVEIAKLLNTCESTIRSQLHYGRQLLKAILGGDDYEE